MWRRSALIGYAGLLLLATTALPPPSAAQRRDEPPGKGIFDQVMASLGPEGATLDVIPVPPGWGDGRVTERDAQALAQYCVWGLNQLLAAQGTGVQLGPDALPRMIDFWVYVWDEVDYETKAVISVADIVWATMNRAGSEANSAQQQAMLVQFAGVVDEVWGGIEQQTIQYLAGVISSDQYARIVDQAIAAESRSAGGGGDAVGGSLDVIVDYAQDDEEYVINDGTGDIVYPTCCY